ALAIFASVALAGCWLVLDETNRWQDPAAIRPGRLAANYISFLGERVFLSFALPTGLTYAGMFCFHSLSPFVLIEHFGVRTVNYGYWFFALVFGYVIGSFASGRLHGRITTRRLVMTGLTIEVAAATLLAILGWARLDAP